MKRLKLFIFFLAITLFCLQPVFAKDYNVLLFSGNEETYSTLKADDSADGGTYNSQPLATLPATDHGFQAGSYVWITGTTNYDGIKKIQAVAANTITIYSKHTAETFTTADLIKAAAYFDKDWELMGFRIHLSAASATSENLVVTIDSASGSAYDTILYTKDMNTLTDVVYKFDPVVKLSKKDVVTFAWSNTNDKTWGIEVYYKIAK